MMSHLGHIVLQVSNNTVTMALFTTYKLVVYTYVVAIILFQHTAISLRSAKYVYLTLQFLGRRCLLLHYSPEGKLEFVLLPWQWG